MMTDLSVASNWSASPSSGVLDRARRGDQEAFRRISALYVRLVYHWCRSSGLSNEDAEDVGQLVFLAISRNLKAFRRESAKDSFVGWLRVITRSKIVDHYRNNAVNGTSQKDEKFWNSMADVNDADAETETEAEEISGVEKSLVCQRAIQLIENEFSTKDIQAFQMLVVDGLTARDVAEHLRISVNSVYIAKSRIRKRLRDEFAELIDEDFL